MVLVVLVGLPGAGKSTFARAVKERFSEVQIICADEHQGSSDPGMLRCRSQDVLESARAFLNQKYSVIIDDTMHLRAMRKPFIGLCQESNSDFSNLLSFCNLVQIPLLFVWIGLDAEIDWYLERNAQRAKPIPPEHILRMADKFDRFKTTEHLVTISNSRIDTLNIKDFWPDLVLYYAKIPKIETRVNNTLNNAVESESHKLYLLLNREIHAFVMGKPSQMRREAALYANYLKKQFIEQLTRSSISVETAEQQFKAILQQGDPLSNE